MRVIEWLAFVCVCFGVWFISNFDVTGQYLMVAAQVLWLVVGFKKGMGALILQSVILLGLSIYAISNWTEAFSVAAV